ncbi:ABC transporter substrate-binding protein [Alcaligenes endophyticus]
MKLISIMPFARAACMATVLVGGVLTQGVAWSQTQGGTLVAVVQPEPPLLMSGINQQGPTLYVAAKIYQGLLTYSADLTPQPSLAKSWTISDDGLVYTFTLQEGVKWHDGHPFSAEDVVFTVDKLLRETQPRIRTLINKYIDKIVATDESTVEFTLKSPFAPFIYAFEAGSIPIVPKHLYEGTDYKTNPANLTPVGTGPFKFDEWKRGSYIKLVRNPDYWKPGQPYLDEVIFRVVPDAASRAVAFEKGDVHVLRGGDVDNVDVKRLRALPDTEYSLKGWEMYSPHAYMIMNMRKPPFDNVLVRQAVMHAINRQFIVDNILFGLGKVATGPIASTTLLYDPDVPTYDYSIKKAKELIKESGVDLSKTPVKMLPIPYGTSWDRIAEYTKQSLEQIGFQITTEPVSDAGSWFTRISNWDYDLSFNYAFQYGDPGLGVSRLYLSSNIVKGTHTANVQNYVNPKADELMTAGDQAVDLAERQKYYSEAQKLLVEDVANGYLFEIENPTIYHSSVKNLINSAVGVSDSFDNVFIQK